MIIGHALALLQGTVDVREFKAAMRALGFELTKEVLLSSCFCICTLRRYMTSQEVKKMLSDIDKVLVRSFVFSTAL